ncbi:alginate O-acetyltransferase AlgF [Devosia sp.]|jgi:alginate O-acetyltransferase complex protein AlgF|uniref:alginate O-acetyltransferase AlgF n=1 Tax=Devosia sp. TaxID=1871048 RepID=UPI0037BEFEEF
MTFSISRMMATLALGSGLLAATVLAGEAGLYDAPPPPDAAYLRVLNAGSGGSLALTVADAAFDVGAGALSPYEFVTNGSYDATLASSTLTLSLQAQKYYTIIVPADGSAPTVVEDAPLANPARAGLYFYNATSKPLQLDAKVNGKQAAIFKDVAPGETKFREVNPFEVAFIVVDGTAPAVELPATAMVRQQGMSVVAMPTADGVTAIQSVNSVQTD